VVGGSRRPLARSELLREPVQVDGRTVGWLVQPRQGGRNTAAEQDFAQRQARGLGLSFALAVVVAALIAALTSALILRRIRRLSAGAAALARRDFTLRLEPGPADELGALAQDFNRLAEALQRYDTQQQQWLADVAHELRTPLAVLRGELEALLDGVRVADAAAIRSLQQEVQRLNALADDLHLLSLAESGGLRIERAPVDAAVLLEETAARYLPRMSAGRFALERVVQAGLPPFLGDEQRIGQVLANLLENVLRHARAPGQVSLSATAAPRAVRIAVADSGPGVPDAALPRLFDRLYRVDAARTRASGGSGLGLAICRSIVEAHGGSIVARHSRRGGLEVELTLPVAAA
jgi:two-component system sensor histidine kinase BaeS